MLLFALWVVSSCQSHPACLAILPAQSWIQYSRLGGSVGKNCMQCKLNLSDVLATRVSCCGFYTVRRMEKIFCLLCFYKIKPPPTCPSNFTHYLILSSVKSTGI